MASPDDVASAIVGRAHGDTKSLQLLGQFALELNRQFDWQGIDESVARRETTDPFCESIRSETDAAAEITSLTHRIVTLSSRADVAERQVATLERVFRASNSILGCLDVDCSLNEVLRSAADALDAYGASLWFRSNSPDSLRLAYVHNFPDSFVGTDFPLDVLGSLSEKLLAGQAFIEEDLAAWLRAAPQLWPFVPLEFEEAVRALAPLPNIMGAPLWSEGEVFGALMVSCDASSDVFTQSDADHLVLFATVASNVLHNARLHSDVVRLSGELEKRVVERTLELEEARDDLARKARQLRAAAEAAARVQDMERGRIAEDLHDRSCQLVAAALFDLQASDDALANGDTSFAQSKIRLAKDLLRGIDDENRRVIEGLRPGVLDRHGLVAAVNKEIDEHSERHPGRWEICVSGTPVRLERLHELAAFRIVQEALNNAAKHASPSHVMTTMAFSGNSLYVCIEDDGTGFDPAAVLIDCNCHMGVQNLHNRAESIGALLSIESEPGRGTRVSLKVESFSSS